MRPSLATNTTRGPSRPQAGTLWLGRAVLCLALLNFAGPSVPPVRAAEPPAATSQPAPAPAAAASLPAVPPAAQAGTRSDAKPSAKAADPRRLAVTATAPGTALNCAADGTLPPIPWPLQFPPELMARRSLFLSGKCALSQGDLAKAEAIFRQGLQEDKNLPNLWRLYLLRTLLLEAQLVQAQLLEAPPVEALATLAQALQPAAQPAVREPVRQLLLTAFAPPAALQANGAAASSPAANGAASGGAASVKARQDAEFDALATYLVNVRPTPDDYDLVERLLALAQPRHDDALLRQLPLVLWRIPKDESSAQRWSDALRHASPEERAKLSPEDTLERARRLSDLRLYALLAAEVEAKDYPTLEQDSARKVARLYFTGLFQLKAFRQAAAALDSPRMRERLGLDDRLVLGISTRLAIRRRDVAQTVALLAKLQALEPQPENIPGFYLELAKYYESSRDYGSMAQWCQRIVRTYPNSAAAPTAYWLMVWNSYKRQRWEEALKWSSEAAGRGADFAQDDQTRFLYWKGRTEQRAGQPEAARQTWAALTQRWPSGYYGLIAADAEREQPLPPRFADTQFTPAPRAEPPDLQAVLQVPALANALWVYALDEDQLANAMLQEALPQILPTDVVKALGQLFMVMNEHYLQQRLIANHDPLALTRQPVGDSPRWRQAYPPAYWGLVTGEAGLNDISPYFILAVMREESRFKVKADSRAGAKGLMQVMPGTALELAQRGRISMDETALLLPEFNIPIGVLYLKNVLRRFDWNPIYAAAAYNAGPGAVMRWTRSLGPLPFDEFVERIPFDETQVYVKRVYASYLIYRQLYP